MPKRIHGALGLVIGGLIVVAFFGATWLQASPSFVAALLLALRHVAISKGQKDN